jgi:poly [ADP-ribose] polymerase
VVYASTLNQSNVAQNNNKFYILQVVEGGSNDYTFFCRWGRVGVPGQTSEMRTSDPNAAIRAYEQKLR